MSECIFCVTLWPEPEVCGHPDRNPDPPDYTTGWERPRDIEACACGRAVVVRGQCAYCLHAAHEREKLSRADTIPAGDVDAILDCLLGGELSKVLS